MELFLVHRGNLSWLLFRYKGNIYAFLFCHNLDLSSYVSSRRSFGSTYGVLCIALSKFCRISLEFCLAGRLPASSSTLLDSLLRGAWKGCFSENDRFVFQHLVWILGLKPGVGGALKPGRAVEGPSTVSMIMIVHFTVNDYVVFSVAVYKTFLSLFQGSDYSSYDWSASYIQHTFKAFWKLTVRNLIW